MKGQVKEAEKAKKKTIVYLLSGAIVILVGMGGFFFYQQRVQATKLDKQIHEAEQLVLFNPLVKGENGKKLQELLPKSGEKIPMNLLRKNLKEIDMDKLTSESKKEVVSEEKKQLTTQADTFAQTKNKLSELEKDENYPIDQKEQVTKLSNLTEDYQQKKDVVGMNIGVTGLQSLAGESTTFIAEKTKEQKAKEEADRQQAEAQQKEQEAEAGILTEQIQNETFPSLGMLRGDIANGGGVIPMYLMTNGPAYNANFPTDSKWSNSSVIVEIDGKKVESAVIGEHSMENVLKTIKLGRNVDVKFKDGSVRKVKLDISQKDAKNYQYPDLPDPGESSDTDVYFGVSGYNIGQHNSNKEIGLKITDIYSDGSVYYSDLEKGDIICRIAGYYIGDTNDINRVLHNYYGGEDVVVDYVDRNGNLKTTKVTLEED